MWSRLSVQAKIFLLSLLLVSGLVGTVLAYSFVRANRLAEQALTQALTNTRELYENLEAERLFRLELLGSIIVESPVLKAVVGEAAYEESGADPEVLATILDSAQEMEAQLGSDFMIVTGPEGRILARTDLPIAVDQDYSERPMIGWALEGESSSGLWTEEDRLYHAVSVPLTVGPELLGTVTTAYEIGDELASNIKHFADCEVVFFSGGGGGQGTLMTAGSTFEGVSELATWLSGREMLGVSDNLRLTIRGEEYHAVVSPLLDADEESVGIFAALRSRDRELADFRTFQRSLLMFGAAGLGLSVIASLLVAKGIGGPIKKLVKVTDQIREGDYSSEVVVESHDEIGALAESFRSLLGELREKRLMEKFLSKSAADMFQNSDAGVSSDVSQSFVTVLFSDLKGFSVLRDANAAASGLGAINRALSRQAESVGRYGGEVDKFVGDRMMAVFKGAEQAWPAVRCAQAIQRLMDEESAEYASLKPSIGVSSGEAVFGSVGSADRLDYTFLGPVVQVADRLANEAEPGHILVSDQTRRAIGDKATSINAGDLRISGLTEPVAVFALETGATRSGATSRIGGGAVSATDVTLASASPPTLTLSQLEPGARLGARYEIRRVLGSGGMGMVFQAHDNDLDEPVALKVLRPEIVSMEPGILDRFKTETKVARRITHRNVVRTFDFGEVQGMRFITMEYVSGMTLKQLINREGGLPLGVGLQIAKQACAGLFAAHEQGVVHRDVKPQNIMLTPHSEVKIMDFGIARPQEREGVTQAGMVMGTPDYMSPEQAQGSAHLDHRSDIYSLGVVFYEMFSGKLPFTGETPMRVAMKHIQDQAPSLRSVNPQVPSSIEALVARCMEKSPAKRFDSLVDVLARLRAIRTVGA